MICPPLFVHRLLLCLALLPAALHAEADAEAPPAATAEAPDATEAPTARTVPDRDTERRTLQDAEVAHLEDLLSLHEPGMAQRHLDLARKLLPESAPLWAFYQGQIYLQQDRLLELVALYKSCRAADYREDLWSSLRRSLFLGYCGLAQFEAARAIAEDARSAPTLYPWAADADLELARALYRHALSLSALEDRRALREQGGLYLARYAQRLPEPQRRPWIDLTEADMYNERLQLALDRRRKEVPGETRLPSDLRAFVYQVRALYRQVQVNFPETEEAFSAMRRVHALERILNGDPDGHGEPDTATPFPED